VFAPEVARFGQMPLDKKFKGFARRHGIDDYDDGYRLSSGKIKKGGFGRG
jgi:hypothetical protein